MKVIAYSDWLEQVINCLATPGDPDFKADKAIEIDDKLYHDYVAAKKRLHEADAEVHALFCKITGAINHNQSLLQRLNDLSQPNISRSMKGQFLLSRGWTCDGPTHFTKNDKLTYVKMHEAFNYELELLRSEV